MFLATLAFLWQGDTDGRQDPAGSVYLVHVEGLIDNGLNTYIRRALDRAESNGATGVVLHMNTYGGLVDAADNIRTALLEAEIPVVVFVDKNAASAGALISIASDSLFMAPGASIGAATVVDGTGAYATEKMQSYMRGIMRSTAETQGRDPLIAEAMVDERIVIDGIVKEGELLTLTTDQAVALGFVEGEMRNLDAVMVHMGWADRPLVDVQEIWAESVLRFLANPAVSSLLMLMMLGGLYFELQTPGVGFPGLMALIGATLFFAPLYIMGLAQSWEIILFVIGVVLLALEIFVIPGFGVTGIAGISLIIFSLGASLIGNVGLEFPELNQITRAIWTMAVTLILGIAMIASFVRYLPENKMINKLVLAESTDRHRGYVSHDSKDEYLGAEGVAITPLRPGGTVLLMDKRLDVVSDGEFVEKGARVKVVDTGGGRVVVQKLDT